MANEKNVLLVGFIFVIVLLLCYLIFRKYFSDYDLKNDLKKLNSHLSLIAIILASFTIIFLIRVSIKTSNDFISGGYVSIKYETWLISYFNNLDSGYIFRGISIVFLVISMIGLFVSLKYKQVSFILLSVMFGLFSSVLSTFDVQYNNYSISVFSILSFIILFIILSIMFINEKEIKRSKLKG